MGNRGHLVAPRPDATPQRDDLEDAPAQQRETRRQVHFAAPQDARTVSLGDLDARMKRVEEKLGSASLGQVLAAVRDAAAAQHGRVDELQEALA